MFFRNIFNKKTTGGIVEEKTKEKGDSFHNNDKREGMGEDKNHKGEHKKEKEGKEGEGPKGKKEKKITRRKLIRNILLTLGGTAGYTFLMEPNWAWIERVKLPIPNLGEGWMGKKMAFVSDIHHSAIVSIDYIRHSLSMINNENPDIIILGGDYVTKGRNFADPLPEILGNLKCNGSNEGKLAVMGNHDYWTDINYVSQKIWEGGFRIITNQVIPVWMNGDPLYIMGADDQWCGNTDFDYLVRSVPQFPYSPHLMVSHNPDLFMRSKELGIRTMIAGHTHGGQVHLPFMKGIVTPSRYDFYDGFYQKQNTLMYITRGLGTAILPVRFLCPPEITVFTLTGG